MCGNARAFTDEIGNAQHPPALNLHLTKSRLNDAPRLCEMLRRNQPRRGVERNKVESLWTQGE
jgi:hypothetical protein